MRISLEASSTAVAGVALAGFGVFWSATAVEAPQDASTTPLVQQWEQVHHRLEVVRAEHPELTSASPAAQHVAYATRLYALWSTRAPASLEGFEDTVALLEATAASAS